MTYMTNSEIEIEIKKLLLIFKYRWQLGLVILIFSIVVSTVAAIQKKPQYIATGKLLFKNSRTSELTGIETDINDLQSLEQNANPIVTEIEVIRSIPLAKKTIADLKLTNEEIEMIEPSQLVSNLGTKPLVGTDVVEISYQSTNPNLSLNIVDQLMKNYIHHSLLINRENVFIANKIINEQLPIAKAKVEEKEAALQKFQEKNQIFFMDEESQATVENLNNLVQEIQEAETQLQEIEAHSVKLQQQISMNAQQAIAWNKLNQSPGIEKELDDLQEVQSQLVKERERFSHNHPMIISLQNQAIVLENSLQQRIVEILGTSSQFSIDNLQRSDRENLLQELTSVLAETEVKKTGLTKKLNKLNNIKSTSQQHLAQMPQLQNKFRDLILQLETAQSNYKFLLEKSQKLNLATQQNFDNVRIIESPQLDSSNVYAASFFRFGLGISFGSILAILAMTSLHIIDKCIKSPEEIKNIFKYNLLGVIPNFHLEKKSIIRKEVFNYPQEKDRLNFQGIPKSIDNQQLAQNNFSQKFVKLPVNEFPNSLISTALISKAFSMLQAKFNLYNNKNSEKKIIVVSSSLNKEGKSLVTANLALSLSKLGHKVLIIDGDLHHASQQEFWQANNAIGLSDVIVDNKTLDSAIFRITENLDLIPSGMPVSNPLAIIDSIKMKFLLWDLVKKYNFIIIDSPPLLEVPDALSLGKIADGIILVTRLGILDYSAANECQELLKSTGQNVLGLVINGITDNNTDI